MKDPLQSLLDGAKVGVRNWPLYLKVVRQGYVKATPTTQHFYRYELTDAGRRKANSYRGVFV